MDGVLSATEAIDIIKYIRDGGLLGVLILILVGGARGWWVFERHYREMKDERDTWRAQAMRGTTNAERATNVAEVITKALDEAYPSLRTQSGDRQEDPGGL